MGASPELVSPLSRRLPFSSAHTSPPMHRHSGSYLSTPSLCRAATVSVHHGEPSPRSRARALSLSSPPETQKNNCSSVLFSVLAAAKTGTTRRATTFRRVPSPVTWTSTPTATRTVGCGFAFGIPRKQSDWYDTWVYGCDSPYHTWLPP